MRLARRSTSFLVRRLQIAFAGDRGFLATRWPVHLWPFSNERSPPGPIASRILRLAWFLKEVCRAAQFRNQFEKPRLVASGGNRYFRFCAFAFAGPASPSEPRTA